MWRYLPRERRETLASLLFIKPKEPLAEQQPGGSAPAATSTEGISSSEDYSLNYGDGGPKEETRQGGSGGGEEKADVGAKDKPAAGASGAASQHYRV